MDEQQVTGDSYEDLCSVLQRFPQARIPTREQFAALSVRAGKGTGEEGDHCSVQLVRFWEGLDASTDVVPVTDSQVCGKFLIRFQDAVKDDAIRKRLCTPLAVKLIGSAGSTSLEQRRSWLAVDWAIREVAPAYFDMSPELATHAAALRALPPITSKAAAEAAYAVRDAARSAAWELRQAKLNTFSVQFKAELEKRMPAVVAAEAEAEAVAVVAEAAEAVAEAAEAAAVAVVAEAAAVAVAAEAVAAEAVVAAAVAVAAEAVVAAAVAVAAEAAVAEAAEGSDRYWAIRQAVFAAVRKHFRENINEQLRAVSQASWESGAKCLERMLDLTEESKAA
jgi:hypothetical protein